MQQRDKSTHAENRPTVTRGLGIQKAESQRSMCEVVETMGRVHSIENQLTNTETVFCVLRNIL